MGRTPRLKPEKFGMRNYDSLKDKGGITHFQGAADFNLLNFFGASESFCRRTWI